MRKYIYRYGYSIEGINKLVPTKRDLEKNSGLSFSTIPKPGSAKTTIKAINATGILRAEKDKPTHVAVFPINGTLEDWHNQGADSIWTQALKNIVIQWDGGK